ncbi:MAG: GAF domain-containing protein [Chloroflexi bacterium]|nr:GAF domain-containing protein [Chloroflexota bacterium]
MVARRFSAMVWIALVCIGLLSVSAMLIALAQSPLIVFPLVLIFGALIFGYRALDRARDLARYQHQVVILKQIAQIASAGLEPRALLARVLDTLLETTHAAAGRAWLLETDAMQNIVQRGLFPETFAEPATLAPENAHAQRIDLAARAWDAVRAKGFVEVIRAPLVASDRVIGALDLAARHRGELDRPALDLLTALGATLGPVIENTRAQHRARARQTQIENLYKAGIAVSSQLDLGQVLTLVTERARALVNADAGALCLWDEQSRWLVVGSQSGARDALEIQDAPARRIAQRISLRRVDAEHRDDTCITCTLVRAPFRDTHLQAPLRLGDQVIGCLCVSSARARVFSDGDVELVSGLAAQAAIAIENARAFNRAGNSAIAQERERLAREMHDTLAQILGFVSTKSQATRELLERGRIEMARQQMDQLTQLAQELYADVREVILGLRVAIAPEKSFLVTLEQYVQQYARQCDIDARLIIADDARDVTFAPAVELQLIRIVQESLANVRKHADARRAVVRLARVDGRVEIRIEDDGRGFDPAHIARGEWPQFGLQSMRERAESVGGAFQITSQPNLGTHIIVQIPVGYLGGH